MKSIIYMTENMTSAGGVVKVISLWTNYLSNLGYNVGIASTYKGKPYFNLNSEIKYENINLFTKNKLLKILMLPINIIKIYYYFKNKKETIFIVNKSLYIEPIFILKKLNLLNKKQKFIYLVHGGNSDFDIHYKKSFFTKHRNKMIFSSFNEIVCLHKDTINKSQDIKADRIKYISNPLSFKIEKNLKKDKIILFVGRITKEKGVDILIKAWENIFEKYSDWKLILIGDGKDKEEFLERSKSIFKNQIQFIPANNNIEKFYKKSSILVLPSLFEGFGMVILEAMSKGVCVISSTTAGGKKLIINNENGILFPIGDVEVLSNSIEKVIKDDILREKLVKKAYEQVKEYEIDKIYKEWEELLNDKR